MDLGQLAEEIIQFQIKISEYAKNFREKYIENLSSQLGEKQLVYPLKPIKINQKIAAVDSGITSEEFHGFDLLSLRCVGVIYDYRESEILISHYPNIRPKLIHDSKRGLENHEVNLHKSLFRLKNELACGLEIIEKFSPSFLLLDGSIVPLISDKPPSNSLVFPLYQEVIQSYKTLYKKAEENDCSIVGVIKDSRGKRFLEIVQKYERENEITKHSIDTEFLSFLLNENERTAIISYSQNPIENPILKDLGEWAEKIFIFYIKPISNSSAIRLEFLKGKKSPDEIASTISSLSVINKEYTYPAALIEADIRSRITNKDIDLVDKIFYSKISNRPNQLKRNIRPFR
jgi:hypothetical protein